MSVLKTFKIGMTINAGYSDAKEGRDPQILLVGNDDPEIRAAYNEGWGKGERARAQENGSARIFLDK